MSKKTIVTGDKFVLCRFGFFGKLRVEDSSEDLTLLLTQVPEHLHSENPETLSVCEVVNSKWKLDDRDPSDSRPIKVRTLYEIDFGEEPSE